MAGIIRDLGSFPNSQIKPRSPVTSAGMNEITLAAAGVEIQILSADPNRVKAIIKNSGASAVKIDYTAGPSDGFTINPGGALTVEGGGDDVFATPIGGAGALEIDDRLG